MCGLRFALLLLWSAGALAAPGADALDAARRLGDAGMLELALNRVEQSQPRAAAAPAWAEWEALRLDLLLRNGRHGEVLQRAAVLPAEMPAAFLRASLAVAARAAMAAGDGKSARQYAARILWQSGVPAADARDARLRVIESLAADKMGDDAFRSMLRFQQDYRPLAPDIAALFVETLIELGMPKEAVYWLGSLDESGAARQLLRLRTGQLSADAAIAQARAMLTKRNSRGYWRVIEQAALLKQDQALHIEAQENLLHLGDAANPQRLAAQSRALWRTYFDVAREAGNHNHLLMGDDAGWADFAARRLGSHASSARALFAYLAHHGQTHEARHNAHLQLVFSLETDRLELAALRLYQHAAPASGMIDAQTRYLLGAIAESHNLPALAQQFWQDLSAPPNVGGDEWRLRTGAATLRSGAQAAAAAALKQVISTVNTLSAASLKRCVALAQDLFDAGYPDSARQIFEAVLPVADAALMRTALFGLGNVHETQGRPQTAADYYLRAALPADRRAPDALALRARLLAALSLARAGQREDARAQFEWLIKNSKDPKQAEFVRQELKKL